MIAPGKLPSNVVLCRNWHLMFLAERMRPDEIEQYVALSGAKAFDAEVAARGFMNIPGAMKFAVLHPDGTPAAAGGFEEVQTGIWQSWMLGTTDGWATQWRAMTKATRWLMAGLFDMGARRLQTNALASRAHAVKWFERSLGMRYEGTWRGFGQQGQDVVCYARLAEDR